MSKIKRVMVGNDFNRKAHFAVVGSQKEFVNQSRAFRPYVVGEEFQMGVVVDCKETHRIGAKWTVTYKTNGNEIETFKTYAEAKACATATVA